MHKFDNTDVCVLVTQLCLSLVTSWTVAHQALPSIGFLQIKLHNFFFLIT